MKVINGLATAAAAAAPKATVDLRDAQAAVVAEVIKTTCCLAVLPRWREFQQYNLRALREASGVGGGGAGTSACAADAAHSSAESKKV